MIIYLAYHKKQHAFYVGKTVKTLPHRRNQHYVEARLRRSNSLFHKAIRKYGQDSFGWSVLEECATLEGLNEAEIKWIKLARCGGKKVYNLSDGGDGGAGSSYWKGKSLPKETRDKISKSLKEYYKTHDSPMKGMIGDKSPLYGRKHSEESKHKMSRSKIGIPRSESTKQKLREANLGKKASKETLLKLSKRFSGANNPSARPVYCVTTGEQFDYAKLAAIKYNCDLSSIIKCCKGKIKTTKGLKFIYI